MHYILFHIFLHNETSGYPVDGPRVMLDKHAALLGLGDHEGSIRREAAANRLWST